MSKTVTIVIEQYGQTKAITKRFSGKEMPKEVDEFIQKYVGERPKHEERR